MAQKPTDLTLPLARALLGMAFLVSFALPPVLGSDRATQDARSIASMDYCADQYVLALADRDQIQALSKDAASVFSFFQDMATGLPTTRGSAEELLTLRPELIVRQWYGNTQLDSLLETVGTQAFPLGYTPDADAAFKRLRALGSQIGREEEAKQFIAKRQAARDALLRAPKSSLKALYVTPSGYTAGSDTRVEAIIRAAGFETVSGQYNMRSWQPLPLETIVQSPPDLLIASFFDLKTPPSQWSLSRSSIISELFSRVPVLELPARYLSCMSLFEVDAALELRRQAETKQLLPPHSKAGLPGITTR